jgi:hypothetical protein
MCSARWSQSAADSIVNRCRKPTRNTASSNAVISLRLAKNFLIADGLFFVDAWNRLDYKYIQVFKVYTSFGFSAFFPFALLPCYSQTHFDPRPQRFLIRFLVPIDSGIFSRIFKIASTSRTACWRSLADRLLWNSEDGESFFCRAIVCLRSFLGSSLDPQCNVRHLQRSLSPPSLSPSPLLSLFTFDAFDESAVSPPIAQRSQMNVEP